MIEEDTEIEGAAISSTTALFEVDKDLLEAVQKMPRKDFVEAIFPEVAKKTMKIGGKTFKTECKLEVFVFVTCSLTYTYTGL